MKAALPKTTSSRNGVSLILVGLVIGALISLKVPAIPQHLVFLSEGFATRFWTIFTYPFIDIDLPHALASIVVLVIFGRELESSIGTGKLLALWFGAAILFAVGSTVAFAPHHIPGIATGAWVPVGALVAARTARVSAGSGAVPRPALIAIGLLVCLGICYSIGRSMPELGVAAAVPLVLAAAYGKLIPEAPTQN